MICPHEWTRTERGWACTSCPETSATCGTCGRASGGVLLLCETCRREADQVLDDIEHALGLWLPPHHSADALGVRVSGTGTGQHQSVAPLDDDAVRAELWGWVARWSEHVGADNADWIDYLKSRHIWAAHNVEASDWHGYLRSTRKLRHQARRMAGLLPRKLNAPCVHCGGDVVQDWADKHWQPRPDGLSQTARCTRCGMTWDDPLMLTFVNRQHIVTTPTAHPAALVTLDDARLIWPDVPVKTMRSWVARDRQALTDSIAVAQDWWRARRAFLEDDGWADWRDLGWTLTDLDTVPDLAERALPEMGARRGQALYRVADLHAKVRWREDETRAGRPAREREGMSA